MIRRRALAAVVCLSLVGVAQAAGTTSSAATSSGPIDANGREWRQLYETTGPSWNQVAAVCPRDGTTPCAGSAGGRNLTGWIWATAPQVVALMGEYDPAILTATPPSVSGPDHFLPAVGFLGAMRWTTYFATTYSSSEWTGGWTASTEGGVPVAGGAGWSQPFFSGQLGVSPTGTADEVSAIRGVWLWSPSGTDHTAPQITPVVAGTLGSQGWYVSDVAVSWNVQDAESAVTSTSGCGASTVAADTTGTTFTCQASSAGGSSSASTAVKRDATPPAVTCVGPAPVFELFQTAAQVSATVTDATSGPPSATIARLAATGAVGSFSVPVTASDRAGNAATAQCPYRVAGPTCGGLTPTRVGTAGNDVITGTKGRDVIAALGGADTVHGAGGGDVICGGDGPDDLNGDGGADSLDGGGGSDSLRGGAGTDTCVSGEVRMSSCER